MPLTGFTTNAEELTLTITAEFPVPVKRLWDAYMDPRQLEKFWGPPTYPATFTRHDAFPGGLSTYVMTGPEGDTHGGYWEWLTLDAPHSFSYLDGFLTPDGQRNTDLPTTRNTFTFEATASGSRLREVSHFNSAEELEQLVAMGMEEGTREAMGQIDDVVADLKSFAAERGTQPQLIGDTQLRVSRIIRGSAEQVWRAHVEADLMTRWMLGPDGWTMPVCEPAAEVGDTYRYEWENDDATQRFGFTGEVLEAEAPYRLVTTERMLSLAGMPEGSDSSATTQNEMTLTPVESGTLLTTLITYPDAKTREEVLATGMVDGMELSYARLESAVLP
ncbi:SRPBCC family protein [Zhihengliuella flava]|uniref:Uncharacterized protein YndB with AHSA1/START domain n=1 Tax=Zhihengliuella flava TaxID=1285193 RepID=A0A931D504_9MICC|nr:SRPBCC family protein [Zhihengliuella flava]MBG6084539.1 uncharacterized protein YndB with AHSA1/START domain [Zhihengliuella flava]